MYKRNENDKHHTTNTKSSSTSSSSRASAKQILNDIDTLPQRLSDAKLHNQQRPVTRDMKMAMRQQQQSNGVNNDKYSSSSKSTFSSVNSSSSHMSTNSSSSGSTRQRRVIARERWNILKKAILNKSKLSRISNSSVRRFDSFGLIKSVKIAYTVSLNNNDYTAKNNNNRKIRSKSDDDYTNHKANGRRYNDNDYDDDDDDDDDDVCFSNSKSSSSMSKRSNKMSIKANVTKRERDDNFQWYLISVPSVDPDESVKARFYNGSVSLNDMIGFNNTGNICLWPSEEIMTYFCVKNSVIFDNKSVCELGGGMTCLAGLMISKCSTPREVFLTDGNEASFENLEAICSENEFECSVECCLLQWNKETNYGDLEDRFDYIICADCLFFDEFREHLCATIYKLLRTDGMCLIFAPNRQNTFHKFVDMAKLNFECMIVHDYDMEVWEKHLSEKEHNDNYDEDIHYPLLLKLKKRTRSNNDFCKMVL